MSLFLICNNCKKELPAKISLKGLIVNGLLMKNEEVPCPDCQNEADIAAQQALERRKK